MEVLENSFREGDFQKKYKKSELELILMKMEIRIFDFGKQKKEFEEILSLNFESSGAEENNEFEVLEKIPIESNIEAEKSLKQN